MEKIEFLPRAWEMTKPALEHIAANENRFYMGDYVWRLNNEAEREAWRKHSSREVPPCGTVGCLAGWTGLLAGMNEYNIDALTVTNEMGLGEAILQGGERARRAYEFRTALMDVYYMTWIKTYAELKAVLEERFIFPEPLPEPRDG